VIAGSEACLPTERQALFFCPEVPTANFFKHLELAVAVFKERSTRYLQQAAFARGFSKIQSMGTKVSLDAD
jgi:hypothetical protein